MTQHERIEREAEKYAFTIPFDGTNNFHDPIAHKHYVAGATAEHERAQKEIAEKDKRIAELEKWLRFLDDAYGDQFTDYITFEIQQALKPKQ